MAQTINPAVGGVSWRRHVIFYMSGVAAGFTVVVTLAMHNFWVIRDSIDRAADFQRLAAFDARLPCSNRPQIEPRRHLDVALDGNILQMETVLIRAGRHVVRAA